MNPTALGIDRGTSDCFWQGLDPREQSLRTRRSGVDSLQH